MKSILLSIVLLFSLKVVTAQENAIKKIKELYYQVNEDNYQSHTVELNTMRAAIGMQTTKIVFYYYSWQSNPEESPFELDYSLMKIETSYNIAASMEFTREYLFNEDGNLVFYLKKAEGEWENLSIRYYLDKNKLIKVISKGTNEEGENLAYTSTKNFKLDDLNLVKLCILNANKYIDFFKEMTEIELLEK